MSPTACPECRGNGLITWKDGEIGYWAPCSCEAGRHLEDEIRKGEADIRAGRVYKWSEIRRRLP